MHSRKPMDKPEYEYRNKRRKEAYVGEKGVPWGNDWQRGLKFSLFGVSLCCLDGSQRRIGLGARADLRSCSEWYIKKQKNRRVVENSVDTNTIFNYNKVIKA